MDYIKISAEELLGWLKENLNEERYEHSLGTADSAKQYIWTGAVRSDANGSIQGGHIHKNVKINNETSHKHTITLSGSGVIDGEFTDDNGRIPAGVPTTMANMPPYLTCFIWKRIS